MAAPALSPLAVDASEDAFFALLAAALRRRAPRSLVPPGRQLREAAVLAPLFWRGGEPWVLLTKRPMSLRKHPGQVAFPGGRRDSVDATPLHTAIREADEELGLRAESVAVLGLLSPTMVPSGYWVMPFVGRIPEPRSLTVNRVEVDRVLEAPLLRLRREARPLWGALREVFVWSGEPDFVWGATQRMLADLLAVVGSVGAVPERAETAGGGA